MAHWGSNLFWYKSWYNDSSYPNVNQRINFVEQGVRGLLLFGSLTHRHAFFDPYWYDTQFQSSVPDREISLKREFRVKETYDSVHHLYFEYKIRVYLKNYYISRIWVLQYKDWVIAFFCSFLPRPKRSTFKKIKNKKTKKTVSTFSIDFAEQTPPKTQNTIKFFLLLKQLSVDTEVAKFLTFYNF